MDANKPSARADFVSALVWLMVGTAIVYGSWTMDRLEYLDINPYTAPGLVPGLIGAAMMLMATVLGVRGIRAGARATLGGPAMRVRLATIEGGGRLLLAFALTLAYGAGMVGRGLPFWLASAIFITLFVFLFEFPERRARKQVGWGALIAVLHGTTTGLIVAFVFETAFLVRLP